MKQLTTELGSNSYTVTVGRGILGRADEYFDLNRRVIVVTDDGVPKKYAQTVCARCKSAQIVTLPMGEGSKSFTGLSLILSAMNAMTMGRGDAVVAVGGGVVGDLAGFAASCYMRGVDFYNVPTTLLSQVDSSIGGKTAINFEGIKNLVGAFHQPKGVLIDTDTLCTLDERQLASGIAESVKMAITSDAELFGLFEKLSKDEIYDKIDEIIIRSLTIKKQVVENDERELGLRRILNFGHTFGHGIEAAEEMSGIYHGECVSMGIPPMCSPELCDRVVAVLKKLSLPYKYGGDIDRALEPIVHDKKADGGIIKVILADAPGSFRIESISEEKLAERIKGCKLYAQD